MEPRLRERVVVRLAAFGALLLVVGGIAALAGAATGSAPGRAAAGDPHAMSMSPSGPDGQSRADGLASSTSAYAFVPSRTTLRRGVNTFRFRIVGDDGEAVRDFDLDGGVRLHLIVVRRDFAGYQHLHPHLGSDGTWSVPLDLTAPGAYRAYVDFEADGVKTVLGYDLFVPGAFAPLSPPAVRDRADVDGYRVTLTHDALHADEETQLRFRVSRDGRPVKPFQAYVGHRGHLVALRAGDLAYSHVHPEPTGRPGEIVFHSALSAAGSYRLFLQFKSGGIVHTAPFTLEVAR